MEVRIGRKCREVFWIKETIQLFLEKSITIMKKKNSRSNVFLTVIADESFEEEGNIGKEGKD